jgi:hypothetical protein
MCFSGMWKNGEMEGLSTNERVEVEVTLILTVSQSVCLGTGQPFGAHNQILLFPFYCWKIALLFVLGRPLWRKHRSVIYSANCQWSGSRRTHNHTLLSNLRLLGSLSVASYDSQGLRWMYSYPPPHGDNEHGFWAGEICHWVSGSRKSEILQFPLANLNSLIEKWFGTVLTLMSNGVQN